MTDDEAREARSVACADAPGRESLTFTHFPRLTTEIGRMATTGNTGSMEEWTRFLGAVDAALNEAARSESEDTQAKPTPAEADRVKRAMSIMMDYAEAYDGISGDDLEDGGPDPAEYIARIVDALESGQPGDVDAALTVSGDTEHLDDAVKYLNGPPAPFQKG